MDRGNPLHGPNRSEEFWKRMWRAPQQLLQQQEAEPQRDARFEMAGRARQGERHKISPTIRSQHKPMLATPGGPIPRCTTRDWSRCSSQVWAVRVSGSGVPVPNPQNAQAAETRPGCSGTYRSPGNTPPHPSFRSRQHLLFWLGGPCGSKSQQSAASKMQDNVSPSPS